MSHIAFATLIFSITLMQSHLAQLTWLFIIHKYLLKSHYVLVCICHFHSFSAYVKTESFAKWKANKENEIY